ncbi:hypothetical protein ACH42_01315 [Endozoicomonas sp. (ex Bugula neritina AB1)]|nr:hypothetical protein ACH42_01315 [Endozoicomonas sp. (ex Bugula neritina AB1)]
MDVSYFDVVTLWLKEHNNWLGVVIFLVAMMESLAIIGLVMPGVTMLFALGTIAGAGAMGVYLMLVWAFLGAVVGDGISFWLGFRYHEKLRLWWPFKQHPQWLDRGEFFFHKYGTFSVVIGRFVGPVRPIIPAVAGMMDMPPAKFYTVNIISALGWAPAFLLPGFLTGAALSMGAQLPDQLFYMLGGIIVVSVALPGLFWWCRQRIEMMQLFSAVICFSVYLSLFILYLIQAEDFVNIQFYRWISPLRQEWLIAIMERVTLLGILQVLLILLLSAAGWVYYQNNFKVMKPLLWAIPAMEASLWFSKWLIENPRPSYIVGLDPYSFPSGHTTQATFFIFWIALLLGDRLSSKHKWMIQSTALLIALLVAFSRLILNVHWVGDVLGGFCLGLFWVSISWMSRPQGASEKAHQ